MVIILEKSPRWVPALRFEIAPEYLRVRGCRDLADLEQQLNGPEVSPAFPALVVIDGTMIREDVLAWIARHQGMERFWDVVVLAPEALSKSEWGLRELGVVAVIPDSVSVHQAAAVCRRLQREMRKRDLAGMC